MMLDEKNVDQTMYFACRDKDVPAARKCLAFVEDYKRKHNQPLAVKQNCSWWGRGGDDARSWAAFHGDYRLVKLILAYHQFVRMESELVTMRTAIRYSLKRNNWPVLKLLLSSISDMNQQKECLKEIKSAERFHEYLRWEKGESDVGYLVPKEDGLIPFFTNKALYNARYNRKITSTDITSDVCNSPVGNFTVLHWAIYHNNHENIKKIVSAKPELSWWRKDSQVSAIDLAIDLELWDALAIMTTCLSSLSKPKIFVAVTQTERNGYETALIQRLKNINENKNIELMNQIINNLVFLLAHKKTITHEFCDLIKEHKQFAAYLSVLKANQQLFDADFFKQCLQWHVREGRPLQEICDLIKATCLADFCTFASITGALLDKRIVDLDVFESVIHVISRYGKMADERCNAIIAETINQFLDLSPDNQDAYLTVIIHQINDHVRSLYFDNTFKNIPNALRSDYQKRLLELYTQKQDPLSVLSEYRVLEILLCKTDQVSRELLNNIRILLEYDKHYFLKLIKICNEKSIAFNGTLSELLECMPRSSDYEVCDYKEIFSYRKITAHDLDDATALALSQKPNAIAALIELNEFTAAIECLKNIDQLSVEYRQKLANTIFFNSQDSAQKFLMFYVSQQRSNTDFILDLLKLNNDDQFVKKVLRSITLRHNSFTLKKTDDEKLKSILSRLLKRAVYFSDSVSIDFLCANLQVCPDISTPNGKSESWKPGCLWRSQPNSDDVSSKTALACAIQSHKEEIAMQLLKYGADIELALDGNALSPEHWPMYSKVLSKTHRNNVKFYLKALALSDKLDKYLQDILSVIADNSWPKTPIRQTEKSCLYKAYHVLTSLFENEKSNCDNLRSLCNENCRWTVDGQFNGYAADLLLGFIQLAVTHSSLFDKENTKCADTLIQLIYSYINDTKDFSAIEGDEKYNSNVNKLLSSTSTRNDFIQLARQIGRMDIVSQLSRTQGKKVH